MKLTDKYSAVLTAFRQEKDSNFFIITYPTKCECGNGIIMRRAHFVMFDKDIPEFVSFVNRLERCRIRCSVTELSKGDKKLSKGGEKK